MRSYNQFCPVAKAAELFCERWTALIIRELMTGSARYSDIQRGVPLMSPTLLSKRLKELVAEGVVVRCQDEARSGWTYQLTEAGSELIPLVMALGVWGQRWSRRALAEHEKDLGLLLWALEKGASPESLGRGRRIVEFELTDQPQHKRRWWFLNEAGRCELCLTPPDRGSDVYVSTTLSDLIQVWRGDIPLKKAISDDRLQVHASQRLSRAFQTWLAIAPIADIAPAADASAARAG
ncbi:MAG: winged helix-turn-helix transcriptional regulator [Hyphomicrobiaceae bacterium]